MNKIRGALNVPGRFTIKLPVCVGKAIRSLAVSKRIAEAGNPFYGQEAHQPINSRFNLDIAWHWEIILFSGRYSKRLL
jgi:hypothetical protein